MIGDFSSNTTRPTGPKPLAPGKPFQLRFPADAANQPGPSQDPDPWVDKTTGAPMHLRLAVAGSGSPSDKLQALRDRGYGDIDELPGGGYAYTALKDIPEDGIRAGQRAHFDERQFSLRDVLGDLDESMSMGGMVVAGTASRMATSRLPVRPVVGRAIDAVASGTGGAVGQFLGQKVAQGLTGAADTRSAGEGASDLWPAFKAGMVGQAVGDAGMGFLLGSGRMAGKIMGRGRGATEIAAEKAAGWNQGVTISPAVSTRNALVAMARSAFQRMPGATNALVDAGRNTGTGIELLAERISNRLSGQMGAVGGKELFTETLGTASEGWVARFKVQRKALDDAINQFMPQGADTRVPLPNTAAAFRAIQDKIATMPNWLGDQYALVRNKMEMLLADAAGETQTTPSALLDATGTAPAATYTQVVRSPGVPFGGLRSARTTVGDIANFESPIVRKSEQERALNDLYHALKKDIENAVKAAGPEAEDALNIHDLFVRMANDDKQFVNLDTFEKVLAGVRGKDFDPVQWVRSHDLRGGKKLAAILDSYLPQERRAIAGSVFEGMGLVPAEDASGLRWSMEQFAKSKRAMGDGPFRAIFGHPDFVNIKEGMQDLLTLIEPGIQAERLAKYKYNAIMPFSITAAVPIAVGVLTKSPELAVAAGGALMAGTAISHKLAGAMTRPYLPAASATRLLSNPMFRRTVTGLAKAGPWSVKQGMRLLAVKYAQPDIADDIDAYLQYMRDIGADAEAEDQTTRILNAGRPNVQMQRLP